jgi:hypothetical protein
MKILLIAACLIFSTHVHAQVHECPKFYPWQDTVLAEVPYQHHGKGLVKKRQLSGASVMIDEFNKPGELHGGERKQVKGGVDIDYPANITWFVCYYGEGSDISWWEELKLNHSKVQGCTVQIRDDHRNPKDIKLVCK